MRLRLSRIQEVSLARPEGYMWDLLSLGTLDGEWLELSDEDAARLRAKYRTGSRPATVRVRRKGVKSEGETYVGSRRISRCRNCPS